MATLFASLRSLVSKVETIPLDIGEPFTPPAPALWAIHAGKSKTTGDKVTIFSLELATASADQIAAARNAIRRLRLIRHPCVVRFIETHETSTHLYLVTEPLTPLWTYLEGPNKNDMAISWGVHQVAVRASSFRAATWCFSAHGLA
eukprot:m.647951 g.647951  ORF g.647951 m.647951 type:complete len:146 (-) comp58378_c0_seq14:2529-2966(-)